MIFRQLVDYESFTYTYLLASDKGREAVIIDPVLEHADQYIQLINELGIKLAFVIDTHTHTDHITASGTLREKIACAVAMGEKTKCECVDVRLEDGQTFQVDGLSFQAIYTPGHTDDSFSFVMKDRVFTGDTLLIRGTGRTDFQSGSSVQQYDSLFNKLLKLPEETLVFPAHDYKGVMNSSIGEEKYFNPRLQVSSVEEYSAIMDNLNLSKPRKMDIAVSANLKCGLI